VGKSLIHHVTTEEKKTQDRNRSCSSERQRLQEQLKGSFGGACWLRVFKWGRGLVILLGRGFHLWIPRTTLQKGEKGGIQASKKKGKNRRYNFQMAFNCGGGVYLNEQGDILPKDWGRDHHTSEPPETYLRTAGLAV